jgi:hypothetical protein
VKNYEIIDAVDYRHNTTAEVHTLLKKYVPSGTTTAHVITASSGIT